MVLLNLVNLVLKKYPHKLVDIIKPTDEYNVAKFVKDINLIKNQAEKQNTNLILVGGSMMYFNALINGISDIPQIHPEIRQKVLQIQKSKGLDFLYNTIIENDTNLTKIHKTDSQRIVRAAETLHQTGKSILFFQQKKNITLKDHIYLFYDLLVTDKC